jgi:hypothetical protein
MNSTTKGGRIMKKMMIVGMVFLALGLVFGSGVSAKMIRIGEAQIVCPGRRGLY